MGMEGMVGGPGFKSVEQHEREVAQIAAAVAARNGRRVSCRKKPGESHCVRMSSYKVRRPPPRQALRRSSHRSATGPPFAMLQVRKGANESKAKIAR